ncbi:lipid IV(A) 3-deoxy-D-manno-octulosonic acid transferase [Vibrio tapetis]|uniref:3-deoxy-D-manno-octulosonic acid transferase n=1 Tax=Vibrio tapetis subsp. tapetis TaxID=1671868 RepID=A0A2N8ZGJ5_9VIBR|nr:lipid IV(A) 3-deoxy-D-manno-octulosonic acid transferase [Vibrio tapetis]SON51032.1 3-deoxy-D-manno-octulosonic-acid transferase [Vibrio tapetis subsp. tapetis]
MLVRAIYSLFLYLLAPFFLYGLYKKKNGKPHIGMRWLEHFGVTPKTSTTERPLWIHAVSVGEAIASIPIIKMIKARHPHVPIVVTTTTTTGAEQIEKLGSIVEHRYMPLDFGFAIKGFLQQINPKQLLIIETELWPNTLHYVKKSNVPVNIVNARLSERSMNRYKKVSALFSIIASNVDQFLCQHEEDAERFIQLGVPTAKISVTGSLKFDIQISATTLEAGDILRNRIGKSRPVWIAASTHKGEDEIVISAHKQILLSQPNALLILVPRHPERFDDVYSYAASKMTTARRTHSEAISSDTRIYLGDTMGEMLTLIAASDVCFMGGSLLGDKVGGHNILEPAALGVPTIIGPSYFNFLDITNTLVKQQGAIICESSDLSNKICEILTQDSLRLEMGVKAKQFVTSQQGSIERTLHLLDM